MHSDNFNSKGSFVSSHDNKNQNQQIKNKLISGNSPYKAKKSKIGSLAMFDDEF